MSSIHNFKYIIAFIRFTITRAAKIDKLDIVINYDIRQKMRIFANYEKARLSKLVYLLSLMFGYLETITDWNNQLKYKISFLLFLTCRINKAQRVSLGLL